MRVTGTEGLKVAEPGDGCAIASRPEEFAWWPGADGDRISRGMADVLVHRLFTAGLDLHAALTYIEANVGRRTAVEKIHEAIHGLDKAIREFRGVVFDLHPDGTTLPRAGSLRGLIIEAVERACGPGDACPAITLGRGMDAVLDVPTSHQVARVIHGILTLFPRDRLANAHIEVTARPPTRLIVDIDAPVSDLAEVAGHVSTVDRQERIDVSCQTLSRPPGRSRIRLECHTAP